MNSDLPEPSNTAKDTNNEQETKAKKQNRGGFVVFIAWMALFFTTIGIAVGYNHWLRIHDKAKANKINIEAIQQELSNVPSNEQLTNIRSELLKKTDEVQEQASKALTQTQKYTKQSQHYAETIDAQVAEMTQIQARLQLHTRPSTSKDWTLSEIEFLIRMANRQLHLDNNKHSALAALKLAKKNIDRLNSPHYLPVLQQLTKDIMTLEQYAAPKIGEISQQITALMIKLEPLPANNQDISEGKVVKISSDAKNNEDESRSLWTDVKTEAKTFFDQAVIVRKYEKPLEMALDSDSRLRLYNLIQLRLETLRLMALRRMDQEYHQQIKLIKQTLEQYYSEKQAKDFLATMQELDGHNLSPEKPDISLSIKQLESALLTEDSEQKSTQGDKK